MVNNHRKLILILGLPFIVFLIFLINWNVNLFDNEKKRLEVDFTRIVADAVNEIGDSIVTAEIIEIAQGTSVELKMDYAEDKATEIYYFEKNERDTTDKSFEELREDVGTLRLYLKKDQLNQVRFDAFFDDPHSILQIMNDSIKRKLAKADMNLPFSVVCQEINKEKKFEEPPNRIFKNDKNDTVYHVEFDALNSKVFARLWPEILTTALMLLGFALSIFLVIKNLRKQEKLVATQKEFINNITHELKTPIASMNIAFEALIDQKAVENKQIAYDYLKIARKENNRLNDLIHRLIQTSKLDHGKMTLGKEQFDVVSMIEDIKATMQLQLQQKNGILNVHTSEEPILLNADPLHIYNVITNLIDNALKHNEDGLQINLSAKVIKDQICISVKDNGKGIVKDDLENIFHKFYRGTKENVHNTKGHGLGLSYVKSIIELHGGTVKADSEVGVWTKFEIRLPKK